MNLRKTLILSIVLLMGTQTLLANYAFYRKVTNTCKSYRIEVKADDMDLNLENNDFSINLISRRNNFFPQFISKNFFT